MLCGKRDDEIPVIGDESVGDADDSAAPSRACAENTLRISASLPQGAEITVPPSVCAATWAERRYPSANGAVSGLKSIATLDTSGAASFSSASHLPPTDDSKVENPVRLPPGCPRFCTKPEPIGSVTSTKTIGRLASFSAAVAGVDRLRTRSGCAATIASATVRIRAIWAPGQ